MTINLCLKLTGAKQGREVRATFSASNDFLASMGRAPALKPESFLTSLFRGPTTRSNWGWCGGRN